MAGNAAPTFLVESLTNEISTIGSSRRLVHVTILFTLLDLQSTVKIKHTAGRFSTFHDSRRPVDGIYLPHRFISQSLPPKELGVFPSQRSCAPFESITEIDDQASAVRRYQNASIH